MMVCFSAEYVRAQIQLELFVPQPSKVLIVSVAVRARNTKRKKPTKLCFYEVFKFMYICIYYSVRRGEG
jgi:hypothetical protein